MFPVFEYEMHVVFSIFSSYDSFQVSFLQTEREVEPGYPSCGYPVCFWSRCLHVSDVGNFLLKVRWLAVRPMWTHCGWFWSPVLPSRLGTSHENCQVWGSSLRLLLPGQWRIGISMVLFRHQNFVLPTWLSWILDRWLCQHWSHKKSTIHVR